jgi:PilZ domain-containing protein
LTERFDRRGAERREPAAPLWAHLLLEVDSAVRSLSTRGMMVRVAAAPPVGTTHTFVLTFESVTLRLPGVVRNVSPVLQAGPPRYDVGVEFGALDTAAHQVLERFVASRL